MKAKNFRIGNVIKYDNRTFTIDTIAEEFPTLDTIEFGVGVVDWNNIQLIELTEDWLTKFGFISNPYQDRYEKGDFFIHCDKTKEFLDLWVSNCRLDLKYVHQLQNLYFALTGEELTEKEKP